MRFLSRVSVASFLFGAIAAGCAVDHPASVDSGLGADAGPNADAGPPGGDSGPGADGSVGTDGGVGVDAGPGGDAGALPCGNGVVERVLGEQCDDANTTPGDGCSATCTIEAPAGCGDGTLNLAAGEACDDGNTMAGDGCSATCQLEPLGGSCGDGTIDPGEVCDDSNTTGGDGCNPTCNLAGTTTLFAGTRYTGTPMRMDGVGTAARFAATGTLAVDATYLWVAEAPPLPPTSLTHVLRRITIATGDVATVATIMGTEGIATNGSDRVWVAGGGAIQEITGTGAPPFTVRTIHSGAACAMAACYADGAPGTATFSGIRGLTWYAGYLWIVDPDAAVIRRMDPVSGDVLTVAGTPFTISTPPVDGVGPAAQFESPRYLVSDNSGTLFISDTNGAAIRALHVPTRLVSTFAGNGMDLPYTDGLGGLAGPARIHRPRGITSDGTSIYWVEANAHTIRQGVIGTLDVSTLAGMPMAAGYVEGTGATARFDGPFSIAYHYPSRSLFVMDSNNHVIRRIR